MSATGHTPLELNLKISKGASPRVDTDKCLNCGTCLRACPTGAIREAQRQICRLCPDCAEGEIMFPRGMEELTTRSCSLACPLGHYPEGYLNLLARGDWQGAWEVISAVNPLPGVLGRICGRPCEEECKRGILIDRPLPIRAAKREVAEWARREGMDRPKAYRRNIDMRVAVAGAGPAGLTAASDLASLGYRVTVFEKGPEPGGMVRQAVPSFRLPDEVWEREFAAALGDGIEVVYGAAVGASPTLEELEKDGYKAVVLATGAPRGKLLPLPGRDFKGVYDALTFMSAVKQGRPVEVGEKVVVIGGGSVATDVARTALRKGAREATMVCIEQECDLPALSWEVEEALREGVKLVAGYAPQRITSAWMQAEAVELACVSDICCDAFGRLTPEIDPSDTRTLPADTVIFAVGQAVDTALLGRMGLKLERSGRPGRRRRHRGDLLRQGLRGGRPHRGAGLGGGGHGLGTPRRARRRRAPARQRARERGADRRRSPAVGEDLPGAPGEARAAGVPPRRHRGSPRFLRGSGPLPGARGTWRPTPGAACAAATSR